MDNYDDIINLPHHVSKRHPPMSMWSRAAQFAPFAALNDHEEANDETVKETQNQETDRFFLLIHFEHSGLQRHTLKEKAVPMG